MKRAAIRVFNSVQKIQDRTLSRVSTFILVLLFVSFLGNVQAQVTVYQYRHVPNENIAEFIFRETNYWSKIAQKAVDSKKMSFWALLEKVGGYELPNTSNYLFINTFSNIDSAMNSGMWNPATVFPGVPMSQIETNSLSTTTSQFFLHSEGWAQKENANPEQDFRYVLMIYHNTNFQDSLINMENMYWAPFIKTAMDKNQTPQTGWGNARVLAPSGDNIKFNTVSYDLYRTLQDALMPNWASGVQFPNDGLSKINAIELNRRGVAIYRILKVVSGN